MELIPSFSRRAYIAGPTPGKKRTEELSVNSMCVLYPMKKRISEDIKKEQKMKQLAQAMQL